MRELAVFAVVMSACSAGPGPGDGGGEVGCEGAAKTPPNLVKNTGFECGTAASPPEYTPTFGTIELASEGRDGGHALKAVANASAAGQFAYTGIVVTAPKQTTYCAAAWVKGTVASAKMSLPVDNGGGAGTEYGFTLPTVNNTEWQRLPPSTNIKLPAPANAKVYLRFFLMNPTAGQTLLVDDVDVWESSDGSCQER